MLNDKLIELMRVLLRDVLSFKFDTDKVLSDFFRTHKQLKNTDRNLVADIIYGVIRNYFTISNKVGEKNLLDMLGLSILNTPTVAKEVRDSITSVDFANLEKLENVNNLQSETELPLWIIDILLKQYSESEVIQLAKALQQPSDLNLRVNIVKSDVKTILKELGDLNLAPQKMSYSPFGVRVATKNFLNKSKLYNSGMFEIQDESSQMAGLLLGPRRGEMVVDFCAGGGGKTLLFGMLMRNTGRVYAFDVSERRLNNLAPRQSRSGLSNIYPELIAHENDTKIKRLHGKIDKVFVDVPCTGLGTLRRNPELKFRNKESDLLALNAQQLDILTAASKLVKPGGSMVYATCSILALENQEVVQQFLLHNSDFTLVPAKESLSGVDIPLVDDKFLIMLPHIHNTDGFFAALLHKKK